MFRSFHTLTVISIVVLAEPAYAGDFTVDVPGLRGSYESPHGTRHVDVDLGMPFAQIDGVSLRLIGEHTPGVIRLLSHDAEDEPYPAEVFGYLPEAGSSLTTAFDEILPPVAGQFDLTVQFANLRHHGGGPNFEPLLDGHARLNVSVGGPPVIAIYTIKSLPFIDVHSATLIVNGLPGHDHHRLPGDFDGDGHVDHEDYSIWRATWGSSTDMRADGNGDGMIDAADYAVWRQHVGTSHPNAAAVAAIVPEPAALALGAIATCIFLAMVRQRSSAYPESRR